MGPFQSRIDRIPCCYGRGGLVALSSGVVMTTSGEQYDGVADLYLAADELLIRTAAERPAFLARLGDVRGLECLDLACGSGFIARILMDHPVRGTPDHHRQPVVVDGDLPRRA